MFKFLKKTAAVALAAVTMLSALMVGSVTTASAAEVATDDEVGATSVTKDVYVHDCGDYADNRVVWTNYYATCHFTVAGGEAVCLQPSQDSPASGTHEVTFTEITDPYLRVMAYYNQLALAGYNPTVFGGESWMDMLKNQSSSTYNLYHYTAAYVYNNSYDSHLTDTGKTYVENVYNAIVSAVKNGTAYVPNDFKCYTVSINNSVQVLMYTPKGNVSCTKVDASKTSTKLKDATIALYLGNKTTKLGTKTTGSNGKVTFNTLPAGTYYFKETKAPNDYQLNSNYIKVTVSNTAGVDTTKTYDATMEDTKKSTVTLTINKKSDDSSATSGSNRYSLKDAVFTVYRTSDNKNMGTITTNSNGTGSLKGLSSDYEYYAKETTAPKGFEKYTGKITFTKSKTENNVIYYTATVTETHTQYYKFMLTKKSADTTISKGNDLYSLEGAVYGVYSDKTCKNQVCTLTTKSDGKTNYSKVFSSSSSSKKTFYAKEISAPDGYVLDTDKVWTFEYSSTADGVDIYAVTVTDKPVSDPIDVFVQKSGLVANGDTVLLSGGEFTIEYYTEYYGNANKATPTRTWVLKAINGEVKFEDKYRADSDDGADFYTDEEGNVVFPLGTVTVTETTAPDGYMKDNNIYLAQIKQDTNDAKIFWIKNDAKTTSDGALVITNTAYGSMSLKKISEDGVVEGIDFKLYQYVPGVSGSLKVYTEDYSDGIYTTGEDGIFSIKDLPMFYDKSKGTRYKYFFVEQDVEVRYETPYLTNSNVSGMYVDSEGLKFKDGTTVNTSKAQVFEAVNLTEEDATKIQKYLGKISTLTDEEIKKYDFDGDGDLTISDVTYIQKHICVRFRNELRSANAKIIKTSDDGIVEGLQFKVTSDNGYSTTVTTDSDGTFTLTDLPVYNSSNKKITYTVQEINTPSRYKISASRSFTLTEGETYNVKFHNTIKIRLQLLKSSAEPDVTDNNDNYSLEGAVYTIYTDKACTEEYGTITTDEDGYGCYKTGQAVNSNDDEDSIYFGKNTGKAIVYDSGVTYYVKETTAPKGFEKDTSLYEFVDSGVTDSVGCKIYRAVNIFYVPSILNNYTYSSTDVTNIQKYLAGIKTLTNDQKAVYDVDGNGKIDVSDQTKISQIIGGIIAKTPTDEPQYMKLQLVKKSDFSEFFESNSNYSLKGAVYNIYTDSSYSDDSYFGTITTDEDGYGCYGTGSDTNKSTDSRVAARGKNAGADVPLGTYFAKEVTAPAGHTVNNNVDDFENDIGYFSSNGTRIAIIRATTAPDVNYVMDYAITGEVTLYKVDDGNNPLTGSKWRLYDSKGNAIYYFEGGDGWYEYTTDTADSDNYQSDLTTDDNGVLCITYLPIGSYYLKEVSAPTGYAKSTEKYEFTVTGNEDDDNSPKFTVENKNISVSLKKTNELTGEALNGTKWMLYVSGTTTPLVCEGRKGQYTYTALDASAGQTEATVMETDGHGMLYVGFLPKGSYYFKEVSTKEGYVLDTEKHEFTVSDENPTAKVSVKNTPYSVTLQKYGYDGHNSLAGTKWYIHQEGDDSLLYFTETSDGMYEYNHTENGNPYSNATYTTDSSGKLTFYGLPAGTYTIREAETADGYAISDEASTGYTFTLGPDNATVNIKDTNPLNMVTLEKQDSETGEALAGAEFGLYKEDGTQVKARGSVGSYTYSTSGTKTTLVTDSNGKLVVYKLPAGTYYFQETKAPSGYKLDSTKYSFTVDNTSKSSANIQIPTVTNEQYKATLYKVDNNGNNLAGSEWKLYSVDNEGYATCTQDADGQYTFDSASSDSEGTTLLTDSDGKLVVSKLPNGDYYFIETKAPDGFKLDTTKHEFTVNNGNAEEVEVEVENTPVTGDLSITKTAADGFVEGIYFKITSTFGYENIVATDTSGKISLTDLRINDDDLNVITYTVEELGVLNEDGTYSVPVRYAAVETQSFTLTADEVTAVEFDNTLRLGNLDIIKTSEDGIVKDIYFKVTSDNGYENIVATDKDGKISLTGLDVYNNDNEKIQYTVEELGFDNGDDTYSIPFRYVVPDSQTVTLNYDETKEVALETEVDVENLLKLGSLTIDKVDNDGIVIPGATFELTSNETGEVIATVVTDENGQATVEDLPQGDYTLNETKAAEGYSLLKDSIPVTISGENEETLYYTVNVTETATPDMPLTGGDNGGTLISLIIAGACIGGAIALVIVKKARDKKKK